MKLFGKPRRLGKSALWIIAALLFGSAAIRLTSETGPALAREMTEVGDTVETENVAHDCEATEDVSAVLTALSNRKKTLEMRENALAERLVALSLAEEEIARNLTQLRAAEESLEQTLALADDAAENDLARLTSVYENMKPKEAAALFEEMSPDFAAGFLGRMRPDAAAAVMAGLSAPTAYTISVVLAGRNANVPTE